MLLASKIPRKRAYEEKLEICTYMKILNNCLTVMSRKKQRARKKKKKKRKRIQTHMCRALNVYSSSCN